MSAVARAYTFTDGTDAYGSQVENEFSTIFNAWNNHDAGTSSWTQVKTGVLTSTGVTTIKGSATNDSASAGNVGELLSSVVSNQSPVTTDVYYDVTSISLTAGDWDVTVLCTANANSATWSAVIIGISSTSGNSATGLTNGDSSVNAFWASSSTTPLQVPIAVANLRVSLASTTTYYFKARVTFTVNTPTIAGARLSARRLR